MLSGNFKKNSEISVTFDDYLIALDVFAKSEYAKAEASKERLLKSQKS